MQAAVRTALAREAERRQSVLSILGRSQKMWIGRLQSKVRTVFKAPPSKMALSQPSYLAWMSHALPLQLKPAGLLTRHTRRTTVRHP